MLEPRTLLAAAPALWPRAPFASTDYRATVYVNQFGDATVRGNLSRSGQIDGYDVYFDDDGPTAAHTTGAVPTTLAYYPKSGQPTESRAGRTGVSGEAFSKQMFYLAVQPQKASSTGQYQLNVHGPKHYAIYTVDVSRETGIGQRYNSINAPNDADFYVFKTTQAGDWTVALDGVRGLDTTMNVFDANGKPIGGTFTSAIDNAGPGEADMWVGRNLPAGATYYVRVDGKADMTGYYTVMVRRGHMTKVSVTASPLAISSYNKQPAKFIIRRSHDSGFDLPLTVYYQIGGTARNGVDYQRIPGSVTIPAHRDSTSITVTPTSSQKAGVTKSITLTLRSGGANYQFTAHPTATMTLRLDAPPRTHRAAPPSAAQVWPSAPFRSTQDDGMVYANQAGEAVITGRFRANGAQFAGYEMGFDDPGRITIDATQSPREMLGYYDGPGLPQRTFVSTRRLKTTVSPDKRTLYLGVKPLPSALNKTYAVHVYGPPAAYVEPVIIAHSNNAGSSGSDISGVNDSDFYTFTAPKAGNWIVRVIPDPVPDHPDARLDATMNIYDSTGQPVTGSFMRPIDSGGDGAVESYTIAGVRSGASYYVRVDGKGDSAGGYGIAVILADVPSVNVAASDPVASRSHSDPGQFVVSVSRPAAFPMRVSYTLSGTAAAGKDYAKLSGTLVIPAHTTSARITITPLLGTLGVRNKTVVLSLQPAAPYVLGPQRQARVTIRN